MDVLLSWSDLCLYRSLTNFVSSYFISSYQQSRYMKAFLTVHYWSNNEMPHLSLLLSWRGKKNSSKELFANCNISKCYRAWLWNWQRKYILAHKHLQMIIWWAHFIITAGVQRIMVIIFQFIIPPGLDSLQTKTKDNILNKEAKRNSRLQHLWFFSLKSKIWCHSWASEHELIKKKKILNIWLRYS